MSQRYDLVVVGGGFGGSLVSIIARSLGLSVLLLDRARHPRFAIGESSTPAGNMILASLSDRYRLDRIKPLARYGTWKATYPELDVGPKRGFSYFSHLGGGEWCPGEAHAHELMVAASNDAYDCDTHWYRPDVDAFLFREAVREGVDAREETSIEDLIGRPGPPQQSPGWEMRLTDGSDVRAGTLIDATGSAAFSNRFLNVVPGLPLKTNTRCIFGHFENVQEWTESPKLDTTDHPFPCDHAALHHMQADSWMWQIRFDSGRTSVGLVSNGDGAPNMADWLSRAPDVAHQMTHADPVGPPSGLTTTGRLQRRAASAGGLGWALLPSAAGFVDPLHSTGIAHTLAGIERLARIFERGSEDFQAYGASILGELDHLDHLVDVCYQTMRDFSQFTAGTMLYFAASIQYERARSAQGQDFSGHFLGADSPALRDLARKASLHTGIGFQEWVRKAIAPWNDAHLLMPDVPNMYRHTASPGW